MRTLRDAGLAAALANAGSPTSPVATTVVAKTTASVTMSPSTAVTVTAAVTTTTPSVMVPKTTSEHTLPGNSSEDGEDSLLMTAAARARRRRETRRPPLGGLQSISLDAKSGLERRPSDDTRTDTETKSVTGRLSDTPVIVKTDRLPATCLAVTGCSYSLVPSPVATTTTPQPATTLADEQVDFKMMYERERRVAEQLQTELRDAKHDLVDARSELERLRNVTTSSAVIPSSPVPDITSDRRERRALERKISELEEELKIVETLRSDNQRLRDENGALIRVISKLSK
jgi:protein phosphatase 1 regulatory subunit 12A